MTSKKHPFRLILIEKLTPQEINMTLKYCMHDVSETFEVFIETSVEYESHMALIKEFNLPLYNVNKTKAQISAEILGARLVNRSDEFDIEIPLEKNETWKI